MCVRVCVWHLVRTVASGACVWHLCVPTSTLFARKRESPSNRERERECRRSVQNCALAAFDLRVREETIERAAAEIKAGQEVSVPPREERLLGVHFLNKFDYMPIDLRQGHACGGFAMRDDDNRL